MTPPMKTQPSRMFQLDEFDLAILRELPLQGSKHGKYINDGRSVKQLAKIVDGSVRTSVYSGRLSGLRYHGFVILVKGGGTKEVLYQATEKGKQAAANGQVIPG